MPIRFEHQPSAFAVGVSGYAAGQGRARERAGRQFLDLYQDQQRFQNQQQLMDQRNIWLDEREAKREWSTPPSLMQVPAWAGQKDKEAIARIDAGIYGIRSGKFRHDDPKAREAFDDLMRQREEIMGRMEAPDPGEQASQNWGYLNPETGARSRIGEQQGEGMVLWDYSQGAPVGAAVQKANQAAAEKAAKEQQAAAEKYRDELIRRTDRIIDSDEGKPPMSRERARKKAEQEMYDDGIMPPGEKPYMGIPSLGPEITPLSTEEAAAVGGTGPAASSRPRIEIGAGGEPTLVNPLPVSPIPAQGPNQGRLDPRLAPAGMGGGFGGASVREDGTMDLTTRQVPGQPGMVELPMGGLPFKPQGTPMAELPMGGLPFKPFWDSAAQTDESANLEDMRSAVAAANQDRDAAKTARRKLDQDIRRAWETGSDDTRTAIEQRWGPMKPLDEMYPDQPAAPLDTTQRQHVEAMRGPQQKIGGRSDASVVEGQVTGAGGTVGRAQREAKRLAGGPTITKYGADGQELPADAKGKYLQGALADADKEAAMNERWSRAEQKRLERAASTQQAAGAQPQASPDASRNFDAEIASLTQTLGRTSEAYGAAARGSDDERAAKATYKNVFRRKVELEALQRGESPEIAALSADIASLQNNAFPETPEQVEADADRAAELIIRRAALMGTPGAQQTGAKPAKPKDPLDVLEADAYAMKRKREAQEAKDALQAQNVVVRTPADYAKLKPGTVYRGPDGQLRRKV